MDDLNVAHKFSDLPDFRDMELEPWGWPRPSMTKGNEQMADKALKGNGVDCPACELQREAAIDQESMERSVPCNFCAGTGRVGRAVSAIILEAVTWAAENYWPERERRWAVKNSTIKPTDADE